MLFARCYALYFKFTLFLTAFSLLRQAEGLTVSSELLLWQPVKNAFPSLDGIDEAFVLVPADYESAASTYISINIRRYVTLKPTAADASRPAVNIWFVPGGPGQSSRSLELFLPILIPMSPPGSVFYVVDHRGLGRSTPLISDRESSILEKYSTGTNGTLLAHVLADKQRELGIVTPLPRVLRVDNVSRDLLKGLQLVNAESPLPKRNFLIAVSYGTVIARRALQIQPSAFEAVILDGLAAVERVEVSINSDRLLQEFCDALPSCKRLLKDNTASTDVRELLPWIMSQPDNKCKQAFNRTFAYRPSDGLCTTIHHILNGALQQSRSTLKYAVFALLVSMGKCPDAAAFEKSLDVFQKRLDKAVHGQAWAPESIDQQVLDPRRVQKDLNVNELVFEVLSALERFDVTREGMDVCFAKRADGGACPSRLYDPCGFFRQSHERKELLATEAALPPLSLANPNISCPDTRIIVLAGSLDFSTPTYLTRQMVSANMAARHVEYLEYFAKGHALFGSSACDVEIFSDFIHGTLLAKPCVEQANRRKRESADKLFQQSASNATSILI